MLPSSTLPNTPELGLMRVGATHESEDGPHTPHLTLQTRFEASPLNRFVEVAQVSSAALTEQAWGDLPRSLPRTISQPRRPWPGGLPGCFPEGSWRLPGSFPDTSQKLPGSFPEASRKPPGSFPDRFPENFPENFPERTSEGLFSYSIVQNPTFSALEKFPGKFPGNLPGRPPSLPGRLPRRPPRLPRRLPESFPAPPQGTTNLR